MQQVFCLRGYSCKSPVQVKVGRPNETDAAAMLGLPIGSSLDAFSAK